MKGTIIAALVVGVGILLFANGAETAGIKEGQWSMTTVIKMPGMDDQAQESMEEMENMSPEDKAMMEQMMGGMGMRMGPQGGEMGITTTTTQCITNDNPVPEASEEEDCETTHTMHGNTVNFESVCEDSHSTGQITYRNDTMQGTIQTTSTERGGEEKVTIDISGEYVGPCGQDLGRALTKKELALRERELELKNKELAIKEKELELESTTKKGKNKPSIQDVNNAVNTTNNVKNTFSGLRSLLGR